MANAIRALAMDAVEKANSGHPGMPMGMADVATVLFSEFLKFNPEDPDWLDRDRFILSAGHGSMLLYALLYLTGYKDITLEEIKNFRQLGSKTAGHPEYGHAKGIETTTGPLGQGLGNAVGMALTERILAAKYNNEIIDHYTYVIAGDGCLMEGISQEVISFAGHLKLGKLIVLFDDNSISIDGPTSLSTSDDQLLRFKASGWNTISINGHEPNEIRNALKVAKESLFPTLIACKTVIAYGAPTKAGTAASHGSPLGKDEITKTREKLGWNYPPFEIDDDILKSWREVGKRNQNTYQNWVNRFKKLENKKELERILEGKLPDIFNKSISEFKQKLLQTKPSEATRQSSGNVLEVINPILPELIGGSADLTGSNNTKTKSHNIITSEDFRGKYIHYGVREHGMAAIMNGMALHKGITPYGGTFLVFTDYCRPSIRLASLMKQRVIFIMTHDSIGLGEDGPTHQPIEHLAALRAIPGLYVMRPADAIETAECWEIALSLNAPSVIALSRQSTPLLRLKHEEKNLSSLGGYTVSEETNPKAIIISTGTEVAIAIEAQKILKAKNIPVRVVSMPCTRLFDEQEESYKNKTIGNPGIPKFVIEAACGFGWERYTNNYKHFIGMHGFGASAPCKDLYKYFDITAEALAKKIEEELG